MESLQGRVAVITGAASGIGYAYATSLAAEGMHLVLADVEPTTLDAAAASIDAPSVTTVVADVSDAGAVQQLADVTFDRFPSIHLLCNNAGVSTVRSVVDATVDDWQWLLGVNVWGLIHGIRTFVPEMLKRGEPGHVVNTCSVASWTVSPGYGLYAATKHAAAAITEALALELEDAPIGVTAVCPSLVRTRLFSADRNRPDELGGGGPASTEEQERIDALTGGFQTPDEIAAVMLDAVRSDRLWAFTTPTRLDAIRERFDRVLS